MALCGKCSDPRLELKMITESDGEIRWSCPKHGKITEDVLPSEPEATISYVDDVPEDEEGTDDTTEEEEQ